MREAVALGIALVTWACGGESQVEPRTPVNAQTPEPTCVAAPAIQDGFPAAFAQSQLDDPYRVERPRSIDFGAIGDWPIGQDGPTPHDVAEWEKPFPCHWTNTCAMAPMIVETWAVPR
jgi:hypothetical protein